MLTTFNYNFCYQIIFTKKLFYTSQKRKSFFQFRIANSTTGIFGIQGYVQVTCNPILCRCTPIQGSYTCVTFLENLKLLTLFNLYFLFRLKQTWPPSQWGRRTGTMWTGGWSNRYWPASSPGRTYPSKFSTPSRPTSAV